MNKNIEKKLEAISNILKAYSKVKMSGNSKQLDIINEQIKLIKLDITSLIHEIGNPELNSKLAAVFSDYDNDNIKKIIEKKGKVSLFNRACKSKLVKCGLAAAISITTMVGCMSQNTDGKNSTIFSDVVKELDKDYDADKLADSGFNFAKLAAKYGQYKGYSVEDLAYISTELTGHIPSPMTAAKFNMPGLIAQSDAKDAIEMVESTFDNMFNLGIDVEDKDDIINLFSTESDKEIISEALDVYYNIYKDPDNDDNKQQLVEALNDYSNQNYTATSDLGNLFLASLFSASRDITLVDTRNSIDEEIDLLTNTVINHINMTTISEIKCPVPNFQSADETVMKTIESMIETGIKTEDETVIMNLLKTEDDKAIVKEALDIYLELVKDPTNTSTRQKLVENLKDYKNQNETAASPDANGILVPLYISAREITLVGETTKEYEEIDVLTGTIVADYKESKGLAGTELENQSVYNNIRTNIGINYNDFNNQAGYAKNINGETNLNKTGKEIAEDISLKIKDKDLKNSNRDVTKENEDGYRERYDNTPTEQARLKMGPTDVVKTDPTTGEGYTEGDKTSEDMTDKELPNKDMNGNDTNNSTDEIINYAAKAADDVNNGYKDPNLYGVNSIYTDAWNKFKAAQDAMNVAPPTDEPIIKDDTTTETKPVEPSTPQQPDNGQNNNQGSNGQEELPTVPDDYVPPKAGEIVDEDVNVEIKPIENSTQLEVTDEVEINNQVQTEAVAQQASVYSAVEQALDGYTLDQNGNLVYTGAGSNEMTEGTTKTR